MESAPRGRAKMDEPHFKGLVFPQGKMRAREKHGRDENRGVEANPWPGAAARVGRNHGPGHERESRRAGNSGLHRSAKGAIRGDHRAGQDGDLKAGRTQDRTPDRSWHRHRRRLQRHAIYPLSALRRSCVRRDSDGAPPLGADYLPAWRKLPAIEHGQPLPWAGRRAADGAFRQRQRHAAPVLAYLHGRQCQLRLDAL